MYMSFSQVHQFRSLHAHVNLLGWASMALIAVFHRVFPVLQNHKLAPVTFWMYQIFFPMMMLGLFFGRLQMDQIAISLVGFGGLFTAVAVALFAVNVFGAMRTERSKRAVAAFTD